MTDNHLSIPLRTYVGVYVALLALLGATVAVAAFDLGALNLPVALAIAGVKMALVLAYFMHLKLSSGLVRLFALAAMLWLLVLIALALGDYFTRPWDDEPSLRVTHTSAHGVQQLRIAASSLSVGPSLLR